MNDKRARFVELLGLHSENFLGSGLNMTEFMQLHRAEQLAASWALQPSEEKRRRRHAVIQLSIELGHIREKGLFATRLAELAIDAVIEGDWKMVREWADHFAFEAEREELRATCASTFATFRALLLQLLRVQETLPT